MAIVGVPLLLFVFGVMCYHFCKGVCERIHKMLRWSVKNPVVLTRAAISPGEN